MKKLSKVFVLVGILLLPFGAQAVILNTFLRYDERQLSVQVRHVVESLSHHGILHKYKINPFIDRYPLHTTLYLAEYSQAQVGRVMHRLDSLLPFCRTFSTKLGHLTYSTSGYLMWSVEFDGEPLKSSAMQRCSDYATLSLSTLRDRGAPIPPWASKIPSKRKAFERYGSPNIFFELSPHFSLFAAHLNSEQQKKNLSDDMSTWLSKYTPLYSELKLKITQICVGTANKVGQIEKVLTCRDIG
jgi:hypothetical protein